MDDTSRVKAAETELRDTKRQNSELSVMNSYLLGVANEKDLEIARLEEKAFRLTTQLKKDFDEYQKETDVQRSGHQDQIKLLKAQIVHLEGKIEDLAEVSDDNAVLRNRIQELDQRIEDGRKEYAERLNQVKHDAFGTKTALADEYRKKVQEIDVKMQSTLLDSLPEEARRAHFQNVDLQGQLRKQSRYIDEIIEKMSRMEIQSKKYKVERDLSAEEASATVKEAAGLRLQVAELRKAAKESAMELRRMRAQSAETEKLETELSALKEANTMQQKRLDRLVADGREKVAKRRGGASGGVKKTYLTPF